MIWPLLISKKIENIFFVKLKKINWKIFEFQIFLKKNWHLKNWKGYSNPTVIHKNEF